MVPFHQGFQPGRGTRGRPNLKSRVGRERRPAWETPAAAAGDSHTQRVPLQAANPPRRAAPTPAHRGSLGLLLS